MVGESGALEQKSKPVKELAREFILSLPPEGLIFHGTLNKKTREIRERGLEPNREFFGMGTLHFFSFNPLNHNTNNLSYAAIKDTLQKFRKSIKENVFWAGIHASLYDMDIKNVIEDDLPAIVVAKRPTNNNQGNLSKVSDTGFHHEYSDNSIPPEDILTIASLTPEEYMNAILRFKTPNGTETLDGEVGKILSRKILRNLIERAEQISLEDKPKIESLLDQL